MVQRNRQVVGIAGPQLLEGQFSLGARIDEDQRHFRGLDPIIDIAQRMAAGMPGPGNAITWLEDFHVRTGARLTANDPGERIAAGRLSNQPACQPAFIGDRRRQAGAGRLRRPLADRREVQRQQVAALLRRDGMDLIDNDAPDVPEEGVRIGRGAKQSELFRRGQQDVRWMGPLTLALGGRGVAGPRLDAQVQPHLLDRDHEIARDIDRERFQRRDIDRVKGVRA